MNDKVLKYESFLNENLKLRCKELIEEREKLYETNSEYLLLKIQLEHIINNNLSSLSVAVDLNPFCFCDAKVNNTDRIFLKIGLGFYVEFTLDEAIIFIDTKISHLTKIIESVDKSISEIKAHMHIVIQGLREIQGLG